MRIKFSTLIFSLGIEGVLEHLTMREGQRS